MISHEIDRIFLQEPHVKWPFSFSELDFVLGAFLRKRRLAFPIADIIANNSSDGRA